MGILGDLNEHRPNSDLEKTRTDQEKGSTEQKRINVGEIPLNDLSERAGAVAQPASSGGAGRPSERRLTASGGERFPYRPVRPLQEGRPTARGLWWAVSVLSLALICVMGYVYLALRQNNISLSRLPGPQPVFAALGGRMSSAEASLHNLTANRSQSGFDTLAHELNRPPGNFEAAKHSTMTLAPGVSLTVIRTDVSYQRFAGYVSLTSEGRTLWLPNGGAQEAVDFYSKQANRPCDLVVTTVSKRGVVGYLMLPAGGSRGGREAAGNRITASALGSVGK